MKDLQGLQATLERVTKMASTALPLPEPAAPSVDEIASRKAHVRATRSGIFARHIPARFEGAALEDFSHTLAATLRNWAALPRPGNLLLVGPVGTGKTRAALAAAGEAYRNHHNWKTNPVICTAAVMLDELRPGEHRATWEYFVHTDILVLDDLGAEKPSEWTTERLHVVLNGRWEECRPTVATTNLKASELEAALGPRTFSRLVGDDAVKVAISGADRRRVAP